MKDGIQDVSVAPHCVLMMYDLVVEVYCRESICSSRGKIKGSS